MEQNVKFETLIVMAIAVFAVLAIVALVIPFESDETRFFFLIIAVILTSINVAGLFVVWRTSPTVVDEVFVMTTGGLLLKHYTRRLKPDTDEDILAGMLTAVQNFIRESFDETGGKLKEIRFESYDIVISNSKNVVVAAVISTKKPEKLSHQLKHATEDIEKNIGERLSHWDGNKGNLTEIDPIVKKFLAGKYKSGE